MTGAWALLLAGGVLVEALWIPLLLRFIRNWRERGNPVSLAIAVLIAFAMFTATSAFWVFYEVDAAVMLAGNLALCGLVAAGMHVALHRAKRFPSTRANGRATS